MTKKEDEEAEYKRKVREYVEADRERTIRRQKTEEVKLSSLKVGIPLGCWVWVMIVAAVVCGVLRWILRTYPTILS
jgi:hypothetical protein